MSLMGIIHAEFTLLNSSDQNPLDRIKETLNKLKVL